MSPRLAVAGLAVLIAAAATPFSWSAEPALVLSPPSWELGTLPADRPVSATLSVSNRSTGAAVVSVLPTCDCLAVTPSSAAIPAGSSVPFAISFDPSGLDGEVRRSFLVIGDGGQRVLYDVHGVVSGAAGSAAPPTTAAPAAGPPVTLYYYYNPGCASCERFLGEEVPRLSREIGVPIGVERRDLLATGVYEELAATARDAGEPLHGIPVVRVATTLLQGEEEIRSGLEGLLRGAVPPGTTAAVGVPAFAALPVLLGGLLDGVNPCAFTTLIFLLASLALAGRGRTQVLILGSLFTVAVFATYFAVGLGLFTALRAAASFALVSKIIRWVLVAVLVAFAGLSVYDWMLARRGRASEMLLQLPGFLKRRIHASIRTRVRGPTLAAAGLAASALGLGFLVSLFEFACTGQVYLPTLAWMARLGQGRALGLLALYNLGFIAPLVAVFAASWAGVTSQRLAVLFQRRVGAVKLALAVFFLALAVLTLAT